MWNNGPTIFKEAMFILDTIEQIGTHPFAGQEQPQVPRQRRFEGRWVLPALYGQTVVKNPLLPLGYQFQKKFGKQELHHIFGADQCLQPAQLEACDLPDCTAPNGSRVVLSRGGTSARSQTVWLRTLVPPRLPDKPALLHQLSAVFFA